MSTDPTLLQLALELLEEYSADLDTSAGSVFRSKFLDPFLERVGGSPLDVDTEAFLVERVSTEIEDADVSPYSALRDLVIRAFTVMAEPHRREIQGIKTAQSLNNYPSMTRAEVSALLGNFFTSLREGGLSRGTARIYFTSPRSVTVTTSTQFPSNSGLNFFPTTVQAISSTQMSFQQDGALYYFDVLVQAESAGEEYNIGVGELSSVVGVSGVNRVTNLAAFTGGYAEETKAEGIARAQNSITIRNLITQRGAAFVLPENFPAVDTLQVIGFGDEEMDRDVVSGVSDVSGIPGGLTGLRSPTEGGSIHIGGKTDIYVYQNGLDEDELDIENLTDKGYRIYSGATGFTDPSAATSTFEDAFGFFQTRDVRAGDLLLIGEDSYVIDGPLSETQLEVSPSLLDAGLYAVTYEIVRPVAGQITVPLYDLVAVGDSGEPLFNAAGDPIAPVPGSATREALTDGSGQVAKTENISPANVSLPLIQMFRVEFLDPLTLEASGQAIPMRDLLLARTPEGLTGGGVGTSSSGTIRLYFMSAVNCFVDRSSTTFEYGGRTYWPVEEVSETAASIPDENVDEIVVSGDYTGSVAIGDRIELTGLAAGVNFLITATSYNGGSDETTFTVREDLNDYVGGPVAGPEPWTIHVGIRESNMSTDSETGLFYFDVEVEDSATGAGGDVAAGTDFVASGVVSEGWTLKTTNSVTSYSTRELPYFQVSAWVNDTTNIAEDFTAPAVRLSYDYAASLGPIQDFVDDEANRIVAEDVLVRHFTPTFVMSSWQTTVDAEDEFVDFINALDPTEDLEVSDLVDVAYGLGATKVALPVTLVGLVQDRSRSWTLTFSQDSLTSSRTQHFIAGRTTVSLL
jgi:hypothetical protein